MNNKSIFFFLFFLTNCFYTFSQKETILLSEIVTDNANILNDDEEKELKEKLTNFETETTNQIVILTIPSLHSESIENYTLNIFNENKLGQEKPDNGILLLFSLKERKVRIEVGYGLEHIITDALSFRIIENSIVPNFKQEKYFNGINEAVLKIIELLDNSDFTEELSSIKKEKKKTSIIKKLLINLFLVPISFFVSLFAYKKITGKSKLVNIKNFYHSNRKYALAIIFSSILFISFFLDFFLKISTIAASFILLVSITYLSISLMLIEAYKRLETIFKSLFTGRLGIFIFPFYLRTPLLLFLFGILFSCIPLFVIAFFIIKKSLKLNIINIVFLEPTIFLYFFISSLSLFTFFPIFIAIKKIINNKQESFSLSFFSLDLELKNDFSSDTNNSRSYSSSSKSSYSSSNSSSSRSFSGHGGSSGGGGANGSW